MSNKHTATPWHVGAGNGENAIFADSGRMRLESGGTTLYPVCTIVRGWDEAEDQANADLIAAAPELLAALEDMHEQATIAVRRLNAALNADAQTQANAPFVLDDKATREAIAKATGGADQ